MNQCKNVCCRHSLALSPSRCELNFPSVKLLYAVKSVPLFNIRIIFALFTYHFVDSMCYFHLFSTSNESIRVKMVGIGFSDNLSAVKSSFAKRRLENKSATLLRLHLGHSYIKDN